MIINARYGEKYDAEVVEAHHINPFVKTLNIDALNQIIICPNHHRIIHFTNPIFDRNKLSFSYPNGCEEKVILNRHFL